MPTANLQAALAWSLKNVGKYWQPEPGKLSVSELAAGLERTKGAVSNYVTEGMPTHSLTAAARWIALEKRRDRTKSLRDQVGQTDLPGI